VSDFVVGLTGGIGSGKSAAADAFAALGVSVVDTDAIAHELTAPGQADDEIAHLQACGDTFGTMPAARSCTSAWRASGPRAWTEK
jgi:dephospho-CoA kinase